MIGTEIVSIRGGRDRVVGFSDATFGSDEDFIAQSFVIAQNSTKDPFPESVAINIGVISFT